MPLLLPRRQPVAGFFGLNVGFTLPALCGLQQLNHKATNISAILIGAKQRRLHKRCAVYAASTYSSAFLLLPSQQLEWQPNGNSLLTNWTWEKMKWEKIPGKYVIKMWWMQMRTISFLNKCSSKMQHTHISNVLYSSGFQMVGQDLH